MKIHSISDIITNSSSELFIVFEPDTWTKYSKKAKTAADMVDDILTLLNIVSDCKVEQVLVDDFAETTINYIKGCDWAEGQLLSIIDVESLEDENIKKRVEDNAIYLFETFGYDIRIPNPWKIKLTNTKTGKFIYLDEYIKDMCQPIKSGNG